MHNDCTVTLNHCADNVACYFLLNYAPHRRRQWCQHHQQTICLAIFFWIMPASNDESKIPGPILSLAIFFWIMQCPPAKLARTLCAKALLFSFELCKGPLGLEDIGNLVSSLLFSFELCCCSWATTPTVVNYWESLAIFFWIMLGASEMVVWDRNCC